jgi:hypothetical protein
MNAVADALVDVRSRPAIAFLRYADVFEDWADVERLIAEWRLSLPAVGARLRVNFQGVR